MMKTLPQDKIWTDDQLLALDLDGRKHELWSGKVVTMPPGGAEHGDIIVRLIVALGGHVARHKLGKVYEGQTGFRLGLDYCFEPDVSFVGKERLKLILPVKEKLFHGAPDLAVEVLSPTDSITKTEGKLGIFLAHGTRLAWMLDPRTKSARVYRPDGGCETLRCDRMLTGNSVLPGFRISLGRLFED